MSAKMIPHRQGTGVRTFSAHRSSAEKDLGRSIVSSASICVRSAATVRHEIFEDGKRLTVLHHVSNSSYTIKVAASTFCSSRFRYRDLETCQRLEVKFAKDKAYLDVINVPGVPNGPEDLVSKPQYEKVVYDFFSEIVIHAEDFIFPPVGIQGPL